MTLTYAKLTEATQNTSQSQSHRLPNNMTPMKDTPLPLRWMERHDSISEDSHGVTRQGFELGVEQCLPYAFLLFKQVPRSIPFYLWLWFLNVTGPQHQEHLSPTPSPSPFENVPTPSLFLLGNHGRHEY